MLVGLGLVLFDILAQTAFWFGVVAIILVGWQAVFSWVSFIVLLALLTFGCLLSFLDYKTVVFKKSESSHKNARELVRIGSD